MSLQIWLPLDGDLHNQGLNNTIVTNNGATLNASGKIGQCYSFNGSNNSLSMNSIFTNGNQNFSFCCWLKINSLPASGKYYNLLCSRTSTANTGISMWLSSSSTFLIDIGARWTTSAQTINVGEWYHICLVSSSSGRWLYINGEQKTYTTSIHSNPTTVNTSRITIGAEMGSAAGTPSGTYLNGYLNDVRIYDHVLSQKEIKDIAKGLVLHYKLSNNSIFLSNINPNILKGTYYNSYIGGSGGNYAAGTWQGGSGGNGTFSVTYDETCPVGILSWNVKNNTSGNRDFQQLNQPYVANQQYTISFWAKGNGTCQLRSWNNTDGKAMSPVTKTWTLTSTWTYYTRTFTANAEMETDSCSFHLGVTGSANISICGMKMELGSTATPWTMTEEELAQFGFLNSNYEYDVSGYGRAATVNTITKSSDSARYSAAASFNGNTSVIELNKDLSFVFKASEQFTISFWIKPSGENGARSVYFGSYNGSTGFNIEKTTGNLIRFYWNGNPDITFSNSTISDGSWQFVTVTNDGSSKKCYINGELKDTKTNSLGSFTQPTIWRLGRDSRTGATAYNGLMSDFRVYATALSLNDVKELYQTSASIDHNGNIYAREFDNINSSNKFQINHRGQMLPVDQFIEQEDQLASIKKNDDVLGGYFYEY